MEQNDLKKQKYKMIGMNGVVLGMAISSRFLLNQVDAIWSAILNFIVLFAMFMVVVRWIRNYRTLMGWEKITFWKSVAFVVQLFVIAALFSSLVKWYYFSYVRPELFASLTNEALLMLEPAYSKEVIEQCRQWMSPCIFAIFSAIANIFLGVLMGVVEWPMVKREQESKESKE